MDNVEDKEWYIEPWKGPIVQGCLNCNPVTELASMDQVIGVGFGYAALTQDDQLIYMEPARYDIDWWMTVGHAERLALEEPDHNWQISLQAPLRGRTYQRHGPGKWVLIESNEGFA